MKIQTIIKDNIKDINYDDVIIVFFAESVAIGESGRVDIITGKTNEYKCIKQIIHLLELQK